MISHRIAAARQAPDLGFAVPERGHPYPRSSVPPQIVATHVLERAPDRLEAVEEELFRSVFARLEDVASPDVLRACVARAGLDPEIVPAALADASLRDRVFAEHAEAVQLGITGIPALLVPGWGPIVGAVPGDVYRRALERAARHG